MPRHGAYFSLPTSDEGYTNGTILKIVSDEYKDEKSPTKEKAHLRQRDRSRSVRLRIPRPTRGRAFVVVVSVFVLAALALGAWRGTKRSVRAVPSPQSLRSDVVTFCDNDLWGRASAHTKDSFLFLSGPVTRDVGQAKCSAIGEKLLDITDHSPDMLLRYMRYLDNGTHPDLKFWIAEKTGALCHSLTHDGLLELVDCKSNITTLCTQSARIPEERDQDREQRWEIKVESGNKTFTGYRDRLGFRFQGIRFAPTPKRFEHSMVDMKPGHSYALRPGRKCIQREPGGSEDCLYMNIFTPYLPQDALRSTSLKPVMFWLHGGAFELGSGADPITDGGNLASRGDVVVVSHNYRLGTLGFLTLNDTKTTGNYGLGDSITALDWTHSHIRSFGGDPNRITIFGQSAGAALVRAFLQSPKAIGKFSAAIMQSPLGGYDFAEPYSQYYSHSVLQKNFTDSVLRETKCHKSRSPISCLRSVSAQTLATTSRQASYLAVDNQYLTSPQLLLNATVHTRIASNTSLHDSPSSRRTANVPLLIGTMADDAALFLAPEDRSPSANLSTVLSANTFNVSVLSHPEHFPLPSTPSMPLWRKRHALHLRAGNDALFRCVDQATAYAASLHSIFPRVYYYEFDRSYMNYASRPSCNPPITWDAPEGAAEDGYLKCHSGDLVYVFGNLALRGWPDRDGEDVRFSRGVVDAWTAFARSGGNPNPEREWLQARGFEESAEWSGAPALPKKVKEAKGQRHVHAQRGRLLDRDENAGEMTATGLDRNKDKRQERHDQDDKKHPGPWPSVDAKNPIKRILRREVRNVPFDEIEQCKALGLGLDYFA